jgi:hypothetical protein
VASAVETGVAVTGDVLLDTDRRGFRRYRTRGVGSGAHVLVHGRLDVAKETGEARAAAANRNPAH